MEQFINEVRELLEELPRLNKELATLAQFIDFFSKEEKGEKPVAVADPKPEAPKQKAKPGKKRRIDYGKVLALYKAGWSRKAIADEVKCCVQTVNHILEGHYKETGDADALLAEMEKEYVD